MFSLATFYQSREWNTLRQIVIHNRLTDEGLTICEYCGKPIVKEYDCIGHHKIELTEENVNDVNISLNEDNIMLIHHKCHNIIHNKLGYGGNVRKVYLVYGSPFAGKCAYVDSVKNDGDLIINVDDIWMCVSGCNRFIKPNRLKSIVFGVRDKLLEDVRYRRGKWVNAYIIGGYPLISERERLCKELGAEEIYIESTMEECMNRLYSLDENDARANEEWNKYIQDWWSKYRPPVK